MARNFSKKDPTLTIIGFIIIFLVGILFGTFQQEPSNLEYETQTKPKADYKEMDYAKENCDGKLEYVLPDKTRVDCLTDEYAIEFDYGKKWAEAIGQSLYYSKMTGKKPAIGLILKSPKDEKYIKRIEVVDKDIKIITIKGYDEVK